MGRWEPNARGRLEQAALDLYGERGIDQVTVAQIAARAGLTERTFFRHFADKREVLFGGQDVLDETFATAVAEAPGDATPIEAVAAAVEAAVPLLADRHELARKRQTVVAANAGLRERELIKLASLAAAMAGALRRRGVAEPAASLAAEAGVAVFKVAFARWIGDPEPADLAAIVRESFDQLGTVVARR